MHGSIEKLPRQQQHHKLLVTMARHPELCCLLVAVILSVFSRYAKSTPKAYVTQQPLPKRFFALSSSVIDYPYGNLGDVANLLQEEETIVVMYYAPWCSRSKAARVEYEKAATYLLDQVRFVAINCWYSQGQCQQQNHFISYPVIFFYHTHLDGHRYHGVLKAEHIISFVNHLLYPLLPIYSEEELAFFIAKKDHAVVGFFDFNSSPQPPGYDQFYYAAMRIIEKDPVKVVEFGLITNPKLAKEYMLGQSQHLVFLTSVRNDTLRYPANKNFTSSSLVQWALSLRTQHCVKWFAPAGTKSLLLGTEIRQAPTLILFTPHHPLTSPNQYYSMLREVALDYFDCKNNTRTKGMIDASVYLRWESLVKQMDLAESCRQLEQEAGVAEEPEAAVPLNTRSCCMSYIVDGPPTRYNACDVCVTYQPSSPLSAQQCRMLTIGDIPEWTLHAANPSHECLEIRDSYNPDQVWSMCCDQVGQQLNQLHKQIHSHFRHARTPPPSKPTHSDPFIANSIQDHLTRQCHKFKLRQKNNWVSIQHIPSLGLGAHDRTPSLKGLACQTNRTLNLLVIDSRENRAFTRHLGMNIHGKPPNSTGAIIIDEQNQVHHILRETVTKNSLVYFISNFTQTSLDRDLRSLKIVEETKYSVEENQYVDIVELSTSTFKEFVMAENKDILVLHYSKWCGFCRLFAHTYLALAKYFSATSAIKFARINGDLHDLPWEYTVETYPALQFYPAYRKSESVAYPDHLPKTLPYMLEFVITFATWTVKLETGLSICSRSCIYENIYHAASKIADLRTHLHWLKERSLQIKSLLDILHKRKGNTETDVSSYDEYPDWLAEKLQKESDDHIEFEFLLGKVKVLSYYHHDLQRRTKLTELQLNNTIKFYRTLLKSKGNYVEQHKLLQLLQRHLLHTARINHMHQIPETIESGEPEVLYEEEDEESNLFSHDEL